MCKDCEGCENVRTRLNEQRSSVCVGGWIDGSHPSTGNMERCPWPSKRVEKKIDISWELEMLKAFANHCSIDVFGKLSVKNTAIECKKLLDSIISKCS